MRSVRSAVCPIDHADQLRVVTTATQKGGVGIGKIARSLGIGASYVQRVVAETEANRIGT
jgi:hypothetical protein